MHSVDVINIYNQSTIIQGDGNWWCWWTLSNQLKALSVNTEDSLQKEFLLKTVTYKSCLNFQATCLICRVSSPHNQSYEPIHEKIFSVYLAYLTQIQHICTCVSDQISRSVMSNSLRPRESQHARPPCPSPTPGVHPDSGPSSQWCHPAISSSVVPLLLPPIPPSIRVFSNESS